MFPEQMLHCASTGHMCGTDTMQAGESCGCVNCIINSAITTLSVDGHVYGPRPCPTCDKMTKAIGKPFGCDAVSQFNENAKRSPIQ
jgi:hypothetical protein